MRFPSDSLRLLAALLLPVLSWADPCVPTPPGLIGWWRGDSPRNAVASGGGEFRGQARLGPGLSGSGFVFDGGADAVVIPAPFRIPSQDFTIEAWIRRSDPNLTTRDGMAGKFLANGTNGPAFGLTHAGQLYLRQIGSDPIVSTTAIRDLGWHHVACVRDRDQVRFYLDGVLATTGTCTAQFVLEGPYAIGGLGTPLAQDGSGTPRSFGFLGHIDELAVYAGALDAPTLAALHKAGASGKCPTGPGNRIVNGSFESPHLTAADGIQPGARSVQVQQLPGWEGSGPNATVDLELQDFGGTQAAAGVQCLDIEGVPGPSGFVWSQDVVTTPGRLHRLRFAYAKHPEAATSRIRVEVTDSDLSPLEFEQAGANSRNTPRWVWTEHSFTAKANSTRIRLTGLSPVPGLGMLIDDLSLHEIQFVPIPIQNPGFEELTGSDPIHFGTDGRLLPLHYSAFPGNMIESLGFYANPAIPGWLGTHTGGTFHPSPDQIPRPSPDGHNVAWINGSGSIFQTLPQVVRGGRLYRLSADLGDAVGVAFGGYAMALQGGDTPLGAIANRKTPDEGSFVGDTLLVEVAADSTAIGKPLEIRLGTAPSEAPNHSEFDRVRLEEALADGSPACFPLPVGLVAWYDAEHSALDSTSRHPGTFGSPSFGAGLDGSAFEFDGSNSVVVPDAPDLALDAVTLAAWIYPTAVDGDVDIVINKEVYGADSISFEFGIKGPISVMDNTIPTGNLAFHLGGIQGLPDHYGGWTDGGAALPLRTWSHVVVTYGGGVAQTFVNGRLVRRFQGLTGTLRSTPGPLIIGSRSEWVAAGNPGVRFNGRVDQVGVFSTPLTSGEVAALHAAGAIPKCLDSGCTSSPAGLAAWFRAEDDSADATRLHLAQFASPQYGPGKVGRAFEFNGSNEVVIPDAPDFNVDRFTLEAWIRPTAVDGIVDIIANKESGSGPGQFQFQIGLRGSGGDTSPIPIGQVLFYLDGVTGLPGEYMGWTDGGAVAPLDRWSHVALVVEPTTVAVWVNGVETRRINGLGGVLTRTTGPLKIGSRHAYFTGPRPAERFNGSIDEFSFYTRALSAAELIALHASGSAGKCREESPASDVEVYLQTVLIWPLGEDVTVVAEILNTGRRPVDRVALTNLFPAGMSIRSVQPSQGTSTNLAGIVITDLGRLIGGQRATVTLTARPLIAGSYGISARLGQPVPDPVPDNDLAHVVVEVVPLTVDLGIGGFFREGLASEAVVDVRLSAPVQREVVVDYRTQDGTAKAGRDYVAQEGQVRIAPGESFVTLRIPLIDDQIHEGTEQFEVVLTAAAGAPLGRKTAQFQIASNEPVPQLSIGDVTIREGNSGIQTVEIQITSDVASEETLKVQFSTADSTALAPTDYQPVSETVTLAPGQTQATTRVIINGDTTVEPDEWFTVTLTNPLVAKVKKSIGIIGILNDDPVPGQVQSFAWDPIVGPLRPGEPFTAGLVARDGFGTVVSNFNGTVSISALPGGKRPRSLLITEVSLGEDSVEFTNVGTEPVSLAGWTVVLYDTVSWPLPVTAIRLPELATVVPQGFFTLIEGVGISSFPTLRTGTVIRWGHDEPIPNSQPGRTMVVLRTPTGAVADVFCAGAARPAEIWNPIPIPTTDWEGYPVLEYLSNPAGSLQRRGNLDTDSARDWEVRSATSRRLNANLILPFADSAPVGVTPPTILSFIDGRWTGPLRLQRFAESISLMADDGNGHTGASEPVPMTVDDDLAVQLTATPRAIGFNEIVTFTATVTNPGPHLSSNVVVQIHLDPVFQQLPVGISEVFDLTTSQGTVAAGFYMTNQITRIHRVTATLGTLPSATSATVAFKARRMVSLATWAATKLASWAEVTRDGPDWNLRNNTATAEIEIAGRCTLVPIPSGRPWWDRAAWWQAEGNGLDALGSNAVTSPLTAASFGPGRVGDQAFLFTQPGTGLELPTATSLPFSADEEFSIEGWARMTGGSARQQIALLGNRETEQDPGFRLLVENGRLRIEMRDSHGSILETERTPLLQGPKDIRDGQWHHIAVIVRPGETRRLDLYVDGTLSSSATFLLRGPLQAPNRPLRLGGDRSLGADAGWIGLLDEFTVHRTGLLPAAILELSNAGPAGKCLSTLSVRMESPAWEPNGVGGTFSAPLAYGRPTPVVLTLTNSGPLTADTTWLETSVTAGRGTVTLTTPAQSSEPGGPSKSVADFGPLPSLGARQIGLDILLTSAGGDALGFQSLPRPRGFRHRTIGLQGLAWLIDPDGDRDGILDAWELANALDPLVPGDANADSDGDAMSNLDEFVAGTDPRDSRDSLRLSPPERGAQGIRFRLNAKAGRTYRLLRRTVLGNPADPWVEVMTVTAGQSSEQEVLDPNPPEGVAFYRIQVTAQ